MLRLTPISGVRLFCTGAGKREGDGFPKHAVNTSVYARLRHPWLRTVSESHPHLLAQTLRINAHIQNEREPICAVIIAVGSTNPTLIRKSHSAVGYTAAVTTVGLSSWICGIGMVCLRWLLTRTPRKASAWPRKFAASLWSK